MGRTRRRDRRFWGIDIVDWEALGYLAAAAIVPTLILVFATYTTEIGCQHPPSPQPALSADCQVRQGWLYGLWTIRRSKFTLLGVTLKTEMRSRKTNRNVNENDNPWIDGDEVYREPYPVYAAFLISKDKDFQLTRWQRQSYSSEIERNEWTYWLQSKDEGKRISRFPPVSRLFEVTVYAFLGGCLSVAIARFLWQFSAKLP